METIRYAPASIGKQVTSVALSGTEGTILAITDPRWIEKSQLSLYLTLASFAGGATEAKIRVYFSFDSGATYYESPVVNSGSGAVSDQPWLIAAAGPLSVVLDIPVSGANAIKITGQTDTGTASVTTATAMVRDN